MPNRQAKGSRQGGQFAPNSTPDITPAAPLRIESQSIHDTKIGKKFLCLQGRHDWYDKYSWCEHCKAETWIGEACERCDEIKIIHNVDNVPCDCEYDMTEWEPEVNTSPS